MGRKEDRRGEKQSTPFFKKVSFWLLILIAAGGVVLFLLLNKNNDSASKNKGTTDSSAQTSKEKNTKVTSKDLSQLMEAYNGIQLSDLSSGEGGATFEDLNNQLGDPLSNTDSELGGVKTKMAVWSGSKVGSEAATISVNFREDHASGKSLSGLPVEKRKKKISLSEFDSIVTDGSYTYDQAVKDFGSPDSLSDSLIDGEKSVAATWTTNLDKGTMIIHFTNDKATSKSQTDMDS